MNFRRVTPLSLKFGFDRGTPIDRYYIERFLDAHRKSIHGTVLEIADDSYTRKFGDKVATRDVLRFDKTNHCATIHGDLTKFDTIPVDKFDCFICTQTLNFIYNFQGAIKGIHQVLKPNGVALVTVAGLCQISQYDMDRWGDYWRFTDLSMTKAFQEIFGEGRFEISTYGNVLSAISLLEGIAAEELSKEELDVNDKVYQVLIAIKAWKK